MSKKTEKPSDRGGGPTPRHTQTQEIRPETGVALVVRTGGWENKGLVWGDLPEEKSNESRIGRGNLESEDLSQFILKVRKFS